MSEPSRRVRRLLAASAMVAAGFMVPATAEAGPNCTHDSHAHWHNVGFYVYDYKGGRYIGGGSYVYHVHDYAQKVLVAGSWHNLRDATVTCPFH
jgi:hypothetical protein